MFGAREAAGKTAPHDAPRHRMNPRRAAALVRRYQRYEALSPLCCPFSDDHYLLEPAVVAGDVLLICPSCGYADLLLPELLPLLAARADRAAAFWRGVPL
jgi:hypothetical protein